MHLFFFTLKYIFIKVLWISLVDAMETLFLSLSVYNIASEEASLSQLILSFSSPSCFTKIKYDKTEQVKYLLSPTASCVCEMNDENDKKIDLHFNNGKYKYVRGLSRGNYGDIYLAKDRLTGDKTYVLFSSLSLVLLTTRCILKLYTQSLHRAE